MIRDITIYDIANKLGLSSATVSRALNDNPIISAKTRALIQQTAKEMGYRHNNFASNLRKQKSNTIGVIIHELSSNFIITVLKGIEKITAQQEYSMIIAHSAEQLELEVANASNFYHRRVDGIIASLAFATTDLEHYHPFVEKNIPVVFFDRVEEEADFPTVVIDNFDCGYKATKHLIEQGCTNISMVSSSLNRNVYFQRYNGFRKALQDANLEFKEENLIIKDITEKSGVEAANKILDLKVRPDGIFFTSDMIAAFGIKTLKDKGIRIPEDIAVVGFNNDPISKLVTPEITTINYNGALVGETAASYLFELINKVEQVEGSKRRIVPAELLVRNSSLRK
jgi:LacI family transcriptional regulator